MQAVCRAPSGAQPEGEAPPPNLSSSPRRRHQMARLLCEITVLRHRMAMGRGTPAEEARVAMQGVCATSDWQPQWSPWMTEKRRARLSSGCQKPRWCRLQSSSGASFLYVSQMRFLLSPNGERESSDVPYFLGLEGFLLSFDEFFDLF